MTIKNDQFSNQPSGILPLGVVPLPHSPPKVIPKKNKEEIEQASRKKISNVAENLNTKIELEANKETAPSLENRVTTPSSALTLSRKVHKFHLAKEAIREHIADIERFSGNIYSLTPAQKDSLSKLYVQYPSLLKASKKYLDTAKYFSKKNLETSCRYLKSIEASSNSETKFCKTQGEKQITVQLTNIQEFILNAAPELYAELDPIFSMVQEGALWAGFQTHNDLFFLGIQKLKHYTEAKDIAEPIPNIRIPKGGYSKQQNEQVLARNAYNYSQIERVWDHAGELYAENREKIAKLTKEKDILKSRLYHEEIFITDLYRKKDELIITITSENDHSKKILLEKQLDELDQQIKEAKNSQKSLKLKISQTFDSIALFESLKGFIPYSRSPHLLEKFTWENVKEKEDGTFLSGNRKIALANHSGLIESVEQELDLSDLNLNFIQTQLALNFINQLGKIKDQEIADWLANNKGKNLNDLFLKLADPQAALNQTEQTIKAHFSIDDLDFLSQEQKNQLTIIAVKFHFTLNAKFLSLVLNFKDLEKKSIKEPPLSNLAHKKITNLGLTGFNKLIHRFIKRIKSFLGFKNNTLNLDRSVALLKEEVKFASSKKIQTIISKTHFAIDALSKKINKTTSTAKKQHLQHKQNLLTELELQAELRQIRINSEVITPRMPVAVNDLVKLILNKFNEAKVDSSEINQELEKTLKILSQTTMFQGLIDTFIKTENITKSLFENNPLSALDLPQDYLNQFYSLFQSVMHILAVDDREELLASGISEEGLLTLEKHLAKLATLVYPKAIDFSTDELKKHLKVGIPRLDELTEQIIKSEVSKHAQEDILETYKTTQEICVRLKSSLERLTKESKLSPKEQSYLELDLYGKLDNLLFKTEMGLMTLNPQILNNTNSKYYKEIEVILEKRTLLDTTDPLSGPKAAQLKALISKYGNTALFKDFYEKILIARKRNLELLQSSIIPCACPSQPHNQEINAAFTRIQFIIEELIYKTQDSPLHHEFVLLKGFVYEAIELAYPNNTQMLDEHLMTGISDIEDRAKNTSTMLADQDGFVGHLGYPFDLQLRHRSRWSQVNNKTSNRNQNGTYDKFIQGEREISFKTNGQIFSTSVRLDLSPFNLDQNQTTQTFITIRRILKRIEKLHERIKAEIDGRIIEKDFSNYETDYLSSGESLNDIQPIWLELVKNIPEDLQALLKKTILEFCYNQYLQYSKLLMTLDQNLKDKFKIQ